MNSEISKLPLEILGEIIDTIEDIRDLIQLRLTSKWMLQIVDLFVHDFLLIPVILESFDPKDKELTVDVLQMFYGMLDCFVFDHNQFSVECMKALSSLASKSKRAHSIGFDADISDVLRMNDLKYCPYRLSVNCEAETNIRKFIYELGSVMSTPSNNMVELILYSENNFNIQAIVPSIANTLMDPTCKLKRLDLRSCRIGDEGMIAISQALTNENCKLLALNLADNIFGAPGMNALSKVISNSNCNLERLDVSDNNVYDGFHELAKSLASPNCAVIELYLSSTGVCDNAMIKFTNAICSNVHSRLKILHLGSNEIGYQGAKALGHCLEKMNCLLMELYLEENLIGDEGSLVIAKSLTNVNCKLTSLNLGNNGISSEGVEMIADFISSTHCKLTDLDLRNNDILDSGAIAIANALSNPHCKLTCLDLVNCAIGNKGASAIAGAISRDNCKLSNLYLGCNNLSYEMIERFRQIAETKNIDGLV